MTRFVFSTMTLLLATRVDPAAPPDGDVQSFSFTVAGAGNSGTVAAVPLTLFFGCSSYECSFAAPAASTQYVCDAASPWTVLSTVCDADGPQHKVMMGNPSSGDAIFIESLAVTVQHSGDATDTVYTIDGSCTCGASEPEWIAYFVSVVETTPSACPAGERQWQLVTCVDNEFGPSGACGPSRLYSLRSL